MGKLSTVRTILHPLQGHNFGQRTVKEVSRLPRQLELPISTSLPNVWTFTSLDGDFANPQNWTETHQISKPPSLIRQLLPYTFFIRTAMTLTKTSETLEND